MHRYFENSGLMSGGLEPGRLTSATKGEWAALAVTVLASMALLCGVLIRCRSGFDFTDEGYYLNWISDPWRYQSSASQFGFVYHPIYLLAAGDVALLRQCNLLILFILAFVLSTLLLLSLDQERSGGPQRIAALTGIAAIVSASALTFLEIWISSPSYNSLNFQSLLVVAIGIVLAGRGEVSYKFLPWFLTGLGGGMAFLAKPTTAGVIGILALGYIIRVEKCRARALLTSVVTAVVLVFVSAWMIDGSPAAFAARILSGTEQINRLLSRHQLTDILGWDGFGLNRRQLLLLPLIALFGAGYAHYTKQAIPAWTTAIATGFSIAGIVVMMDLDWTRPVTDMFQWALFLSFFLGTIAASTYDRWRTMSRRSQALVVCLSLFPLAYAIGTSANFWPAAGRAGFFWLLSALILISEKSVDSARWPRLLPVASLSLLISAAIVHTAAGKPYRQLEALRLQDNVTQINPEGSALRLSAPHARYIRSLNRLASQNGFETGTFMLDMSGVSPGSLYVLGARPLGTAWTLGGYPGSREFLEAAFDAEGCDTIASSWILLERDAPEGYHPEILKRVGIDIHRDYSDLGAITSVRSFPPRELEHHLLKPSRTVDAARKACSEARQVAR
jgi:hypothetical protein